MYVTSAPGGELLLELGLIAHPLDSSLATQLQYACLDEIFHGQRSLADYIPWLSKELDTTE